MATSVLSLRTRTLLFLCALVTLSGAGVFLLWDSQTRLNLASSQIQEVLLPAGRLIEQARTEIDLQIQELTLLHRETQNPLSGANAGTVTSLAPAQIARLRLTPGVRSLLALQSNQTFPSILVPLFRPWAELAESYEAHVPQMRTLADALPSLRDLRQKTVLLHRTVDRELSVQLLTVTQGGREHLGWGFAGLVIAIFGGGIFLFLLTTWMRPLVKLTRWIDSGVGDARSITGASPLPRSVVGAGILAPPAEVQELVEALRGLVQKLRTAGQELDARDQKTAENERAIGTMFSAIQSLLRHNEKLLAELIKKERLASMGEMAAQLAHEIRNPLNSLNLKLELLREELGESERAQLDRVRVEIDRLDALTESHLRTTRSVLQGAPAFPPAIAATGICRVSDAIDAVVDTLKPELDRRGIFVQRLVRDPELRAACPANVLKAALMNLVKNAAEALEGVEAPVIRLRAESSGANDWIIGVADTGRGFPELLLSREFESFRTDKPGGSGLGLVTSQKMLAPYGVELRLTRGVEPFLAEATLTGPVNERASKSTRALGPVLNSELE